MKTVITTSPEEAAGFIKRGGIVAFPTETVYGLGANVFDEGAILRIFEAKRRPADNPLIADIADVGQIGLLAAEVTVVAERLIDKFFPGPLTLVLRKSERVPTIATAGLDTIGLRMPNSHLAHRFLTACGVPVVGPSANLSGRPSPTTWQAVVEDLDGRIDCILQGEPTEIGLESTVVDCTSDVPVVLRSGSVSLEHLREVVPGTQMHGPASEQRPRSHGMIHRHYSPRAKVVIVDSPDGIVFSDNAGFIGLSDPGVSSAVKQVCSDAAEYAHSLFEFFRECDRLGAATIYCERVVENGIGVALMDRIRRAAE